MQFGDLAAYREAQIIDWAAKQGPNAQFTGETVFFKLFEDRGMTDRMIKEVGGCYSAACRDLQRKQILKRIGDPKREIFVLNDSDEIASVINAAKQLISENEV